MRTIKFRGKRLDGEWVYGYYQPYKNDMAAFIGNYNGITDIPAVYKVIPESVGQWTGLVDKNGKEIYEGDIVRVFQPFNVPTKAIVELNDGCFELKGIELTWRDYVKCFVVNHAIEIIGNIHDNPELMEVE